MFHKEGISVFYTVYLTLEGSSGGGGIFASITVFWFED
jgi:hypothetical protein